MRPHVSQHGQINPIASVGSGIPNNRGTVCPKCALQCVQGDFMMAFGSPAQWVIVERPKIYKMLVGSSGFLGEKVDSGKIAYAYPIKEPA